MASKVECFSRDYYMFKELVDYHKAAAWRELVQIETEINHLEQESYANISSSEASDHEALFAKLNMKYSLQLAQVGISSAR